MHITDEGDEDKSVKTAGSVRVVPIHSELIQLGFLDRVKELRSKGETRVFPEAEQNSRGQWVAGLSTGFSKYLTKLGIKNGRGISLYSFRHGAADAFRRAGLMDEEFGYILGHTKATMTQQYGVLPQGMLNQRAELIEKIAYQGLDLSHLA